MLVSEQETLGISELQCPLGRGEMGQDRVAPSLLPPSLRLENAPPSPVPGLRKPHNLTSHSLPRRSFVFFPSRGFLWGWALWGCISSWEGVVLRGKALVLLSASMAPLSPFESGLPCSDIILGTLQPQHYSPQGCSCSPLPWGSSPSDLSPHLPPPSVAWPPSASLCCPSLTQAYVSWGHLLGFIPLNILDTACFSVHLKFSEVDSGFKV